MAAGGKSTGRRGALLAVITTVVGCGPQRPSAIAQAFPKKEVTIYVAVSARVADSDTGNVSAMVDALEEDLREDGYFVNIEGARLDERPPRPRLEIQVRASDSGDAELRGAGQLTSLLVPVAGIAFIGAGVGRMEVDAYVVDAKGASQYVGHFRGSSSSSSIDPTASIHGGLSVGHAIAGASFARGEAVTRADAPDVATRCLRAPVRRQNRRGGPARSSRSHPSHARRRSSRHPRRHRPGR